VTTRKDRALTVVTKYAAKVHVAVHRRSGGRLVRTFRGGDVVLLTHTGRTSGRTFTTPVLYVRDGDDYVVAASNGGIDAEPQWWLNLQAHPHGVAEIGGSRIPVVASTVDDADRQRLWDALMAKCPTYDDYQAGVSRRISLVRLSPIGEEQAASQGRRGREGQAAPRASATRWWTAASSGRLCRSSVRASARRAQPLAGASPTSRVSASSARCSWAEPK
jgi:deazaflavin-dependent oxidoreductase (nitroreductase family)